MDDDDDEDEPRRGSAKDHPAPARIWGNLTLEDIFDFEPRPGEMARRSESERHVAEPRGWWVLSNGQLRPRKDFGNVDFVWSANLSDEPIWRRDRQGRGPNGRVPSRPGCSLWWDYDRRRWFFFPFPFAFDGHSGEHLLKPMPDGAGDKAPPLKSRRVWPADILG